MEGGSIFTSFELTELETQLVSLQRAARDVRTLAKEEFYKLTTTFEAEAMQRQNSGDRDGHKLLVEATTLWNEQTKQVEDEINADIQFLEQQVRHVQDLKTDRNYWKELELRTLLGDELLDTGKLSTELQKFSEKTKAGFLDLILHIRGKIETAEIEDLVSFLRNLQDKNLPPIPYGSKKEEPQTSGEEKKKGGEQESATIGDEK
eukprot:TRINITY_DN1203_c1_g5_i1.p1 TRINITY_DN1203_c1_g5~~TRINITY_DN1203_c1_g5_i1.p1  ORF type:complete len:235 (-),score=73.27 TRINITY_DN1203_c1_g5_i1:308-922(-)